MMKYLTIIATLLLCSCSNHRLSEGAFNVMDADIPIPSSIRPVVNLDSTSSEEISGYVYLDINGLVQEFANQLDLSYKKTYFFYPGGNLGKNEFIGEGVDTLNFSLQIAKDREIMLPDFGSDAIGIRIEFYNQTHTSDTTFIEFF